MNRALQVTGLSNLLVDVPSAPSSSSGSSGTQGNWTLFAPTGDAWQRFVRHSSSRRTEDDLLGDPNLKALLMHHLAEGVFDPQARRCYCDAGAAARWRRSPSSVLASACLRAGSVAAAFPVGCWPPQHSPPPPPAALPPPLPADSVRQGPSLGRQAAQGLPAGALRLLVRAPSWGDSRLDAACCCSEWLGLIIIIHHLRHKGVFASSPCGFPSSLQPPVENHSGSGLFGELVMKDGQARFFCSLLSGSNAARRCSPFNASSLLPRHSGRTVAPAAGRTPQAVSAHHNLVLTCLFAAFRVLACFFDSQTLAVSFSAQCAPCLGNGAGPFSATAATVQRTQTRNGMVYFVDQVLIPASLCGAFSDYNAWQCCGGCDGCKATCSQASSSQARGGGATGGPGAVIIDKACKAFCAGELGDDLVADKGAPSANKTALAISVRFAAPKLPNGTAAAQQQQAAGPTAAGAAAPAGAVTTMASKAAPPPFVGG